jgi:formate dehydrogenase major subunit
VELIRAAGTPIMDDVIEFAKRFNNEQNAVIVFSEKELSSNTCAELFNLAMITGKLGKTSNGLISLKEKNNSQGIFDMGVCLSQGVGGMSLKDEGSRLKTEELWKVKGLPEKVHEDIYDHLEAGQLKNIFIFGEDPLGCTHHKVQTAGWLSIADFVVVQDYFMTETAKHAHLILPASLPLETGGSFTNTQRVIQQFEATFVPKVERTGVQQLADLMVALGIRQSAETSGVLNEALSLLSEVAEIPKLSFKNTSHDNPYRLYEHGCDSIVRRFDEEFEKAFVNVKENIYEGV